MVLDFSLHGYLLTWHVSTFFFTLLILVDVWNQLARYCYSEIEHEESNYEIACQDKGKIQTTDCMLILGMQLGDPSRKRTLIVTRMILF